MCVDMQSGFQIEVALSSENFCSRHIECFLEFPPPILTSDQSRPQPYLDLPVKGDDDSAKTKRDVISAAEGNAVSDKQASGRHVRGAVRAGMLCVPG